MSEIHPENYSHLRNLLSERIAVNLPDDKVYLAEARLHGLARKHTQGDINALIEKACNESHDELRSQLVEAMAINETYFFRDPIFSESLIDHMIPNLMQRRSREKNLTIWSAACSTGQEPYSIAILLEDRFPELRHWDIQIIASDFSGSSLSKAEAGHYGIAQMNRGMPARYMAQYFEQIDLEWQVKPMIRDKIQFQRINLIEEWPDNLPRFDIVLLRNVLLYFSAADRQRVLTRVRERMQDDGYLLLGAAESLEKNSGFLPVAASKYGSFYQPV